MEKIIYITGGSSKIGQILRKNLFELSYKVFIYSRNEHSIFGNESFIHFSLGNKIEPIEGNYEHIIFHLAHDYYDRKSDDNNINVSGLKNIIKSFNTKENKKIIFISTPDVNNPNSTIYTSQKKLSESILNPNKDLIIRSSLIVSENAMNNIFQYLPKFGIPIPTNKSKLAPMSVENFSDNLLSQGLNTESSGVVLFSGKKLITLKTFLKENHKINTFNLPNSLWFMLAFLLKISHMPKLFYLSERILGYIYLRDIEILKEESIKKIFI